MATDKDTGRPLPSAARDQLRQLMAAAGDGGVLRLPREPLAPARLPTGPIPVDPSRWPPCECWKCKGDPEPVTEGATLSARVAEETIVRPWRNDPSE